MELTDFEKDLLEQFLWNLPEAGTSVSTLRVLSRQRAARRITTVFRDGPAGEEWSFTLDAEIATKAGVYLEAELFMVGPQPTRVEVWAPRADWDGDTTGYQFELRL